MPSGTPVRTLGGLGVGRRGPGTQRLRAVQGAEGSDWVSRAQASGRRAVSEGRAPNLGRLGWGARPRPHLRS